MKGHAAASQQPRQRSNFQIIFLKGCLTKILSNIADRLMRSLKRLALNLEPRRMQLTIKPSTLTWTCKWNPCNMQWNMEMLRDLLVLVWPMIGTDGQRISSLTRSRLGIFQAVRCKSFMLA